MSLPEEAVAPPRLDHDDFGRLLDGFAACFDYLVVAANPGIGVESVAALMARSQRSLVVTDQTVQAGRQNKHLIRALRQADTPMDNAGLVVDRYDPQLDLTRGRLAELLELPQLGSLGGQRKVHIEAMNAGQSLYDYAPRDAYCRDVETLIRALNGEEVPAAKPAGLFSRWFG